jgi:hypothetical protein
MEIKAALIEWALLPLTEKKKAIPVQKKQSRIGKAPTVLYKRPGYSTS